MNISFAWWNTSLSPPRRRGATEEQKSVARDVINFLTSEIGVDCLALGEVTSEDLKYFQSELDSRDYELFDGTSKEGNIQFDTGVLFRKDAFVLIDDQSLISTSGNRSLKVANKLDLLILNSGAVIHLFVSHWPSRIWCDKNDPRRHQLGMRLRDQVLELNKSQDGSVYTILLGDYNDEPFDSSLAEQLLASRDRRLVQKNPTLLYNPFWRYLGEKHPHVPGIPCQSYSGSCHYSSDPDTHWRTFDQIIFSSAFLGNSEWQLKEKETKILQIEPYCDSVVSAKEIFDHFPVISVIERNENDG